MCAAQVGEGLYRLEGLSVHRDLWLMVLVSWSWLEHHLSRLGVDGEAEVVAGCGEAVHLHLHLMLITGIEGAVVGEEKVSKNSLLRSGRGLLLNAVVIELEVLEFAVQVQLEFLGCLWAFQFGCVEFLGHLLPLGPPLGLDERVQSGDDQAVVRPAVRTTHSFGQSHVPPVLGPGDDFVNEMPMPRACC